MANAAFHIMSVYFVGRAYFYFRKNGGIWGTAQTDNLIEDRMLQKGASLMKKGANVVENKIDESNIKEKTTDLEQEQLRVVVSEP